MASENSQMGSFYPSIEAALKISRTYPSLVPKNYNLLVKKSEKASTQEEIIDFFTQVVKMLNISEGNGATDAELLPKHIDGICVYSGNPATKDFGCKEGGSEKLKTCMKVMMGILKKYLASIPNKEVFDTNKLVMKAFTKAIRTLVYFYSYKQKGSVLNQDEPLITFFNQINAMFPAPGGEKKNNDKTNVEKIPRMLIRVTCNKNLYDCGRFVIDAECEKSGRYFVVIDAKDPASNEGAYPGLGDRVSEISTVCGGRRKKTRKQKKSTGKHKKTRGSKHR